MIPSNLLHSFLFLLIFTFSTAAFAAGETVGVSSQRGIFSFTLGYEYTQARILNTDSTFSSYTGGGLRSEIEVSLNGNGPGNFRLLGVASLTNAKGEQNSNDKIENREALLGAKIYVNDWLYGGAAYGKITQVIEAENSEATVTNPVSTAGLGVEFHLAGNWYSTVSLWYFQTLIKKNAELEATSFSEGINAYLGFTWSPPSTSITQIFK